MPISPAKTTTAGAVIIDAEKASWTDPYGIVRSMSSDALGPFAAEGFDGFIPPQLRYWRNGVIVLEYPPRYVTVSGNSDVYRIPTPWSVYVAEVDTHVLHIFARPAALTGLDDLVYHYYLSNIHQNAVQCHGHLAEGVTQPPSDTPIQAALALVTQFWLTNFNGGFYYNNYAPDLLADEARAQLVAQGDGPNMWVNNKKYFTWLETLTPVDLCQWHWKDAGPLQKYLPASGHSFYERLHQAIKAHGKFA